MFDENGYKLKAGALIIKKENGKNFLLLVYRKLWDDYSFPKGSIEDGETAKEAAIRELKEETGITVNLVGDLPDQLYDYPNSGKVRVHMYYGTPVVGGEVAQETDEKAVWVAEEQVEEKLSYDNLKEYYRKVRDRLWCY